MSYEIRHATPAELRAVSNTVGTALLFGPRDDDAWAQAEPSWLETSTIAAWEGATCAGSVSQFIVETTVPGGARLGTGAVSRVGVLPTHRRQGIASALMRALVDDAVARGLPLMSLRASEAVIYERYGFGMAGEFRTIAVAAGRARPVRGAATDGTIRFVERDRVLATVQPIYERSMHRRVGMVTRPASWWRRYFADAVKLGTTSFVVVHVDDAGEADGYAHYDVAWDEGGPGAHGGKGDVHEVIAADQSVELALWSFLFDLDLVRTWNAEERPVDDVVQLALHDRRAYSVTSVDDEQWVRLVDVDAALSARTYRAATGSVAIAVTDPWIPANSGTWRIDAGGAVRDDAAPPDLRCGVATISAAYLGGTSWYALAATGRVEVLDPAAVTVADDLFASIPLPVCGSFF